MTSAPSRSRDTWKFVGTCVEGQPFLVDGVDAWSAEWRRVPGEAAEVQDPLYGQLFRFDVYEIDGASGTIRMATGECSANVYLFYVATR